MVLDFTQALPIVKFFFIGGVEIGNDVFIGSNCNVDRGHIDNTVIHDFVRIDNQVHIAHNCKIGKTLFWLENQQFLDQLN